MRTSFHRFIFAFFLGCLSGVWLSAPLLAAEASWDSNVPKLEKDTHPYFALNSGVSLTTLDSLSLDQTNHVIFGGFSWENDSIVASSLIVDYREHRDVHDISNQVARFTQLGPGEILWKPLHLGLRFDGVTTGYDFRLGFSNVYRWGIVAVVNILRRPSFRIDFRTGYQGEQMQLNDSSISRTGLPQALVFSWQLSRFTGQIKAEFRFYVPWEQNTWEFELGAYMRLRLFSIGPVPISLRLDMSYQRQPILEVFRGEPNWFLGTLGLEVRI